MDWRKLLKPNLWNLLLTLGFFVLVHLFFPFFFESLEEVSLLTRSCGSPCTGSGPCPLIYVCSGFHVNLNVLEIGSFLLVYYLVSVLVVTLVQKR